MFLLSLSKETQVQECRREGEGFTMTQRMPPWDLRRRGDQKSKFTDKEMLECRKMRGKEQELQKYTAYTDDEGEKGVY